MNCTTLFAPLCFLPHSIRRRFFHAVYRYFLGETRYFRFLQEHDNDSEECSKLPEYLRRKELGQRVLIQSFPFFEGYIRSNVCVQSMRQLYEIECFLHPCVVDCAKGDSAIFARITSLPFALQSSSSSCTKHTPCFFVGKTR